MTIEKINKLGLGYESQKTVTHKKNINFATTDNIQISEAARKRAEEVKLQADVEFYTKLTVSQPEREEKVHKLTSVKEKLKQGFYDNPSPEVLEKVAHNLVNVLMADRQQK
ncbi:MAG: flagellar biosynthesis anti-sigma factor FlgM [Spirochaetota bacterium]